jgi:prephenate dehydrogenase
MIDRLAVLGVGLIGGSLARALRAAGAVGEIVGYGRSLGNLELAVSQGVIDRAAVTVVEAVRQADMVVLAVPVGSMAELLHALAGALAPEAVVTDVGSVKQSVVRSARAALGSDFARFVPGHPLAGNEQSGVSASQAALFRHRRVILTPEAETEPEATKRVEAMWQAAGAQVVLMPAEAHDRLLAASSHLPHVLAYALVDLIVRQDDHHAIFECVAGGFRDFTRIASSDPVLWRDICLANERPIVAWLERYRAALGEIAAAIERGDGQWLYDTFTRAKHARDKYVKNDQ